MTMDAGFAMQNNLSRRISVTKNHLMKHDTGADRLEPLTQIKQTSALMSIRYLCFLSKSSKDSNDLLS